MPEHTEIALKVSRCTMQNAHFFVATHASSARIYQYSQRDEASGVPILWQNTKNGTFL